MVNLPGFLARWPGAGLARIRQAPRRWVGLDLGSASIKLVDIEQRGAQVRVVKSLIQELPAGAQPGDASRPGASSGVDRVGWLQAAFKECRAAQVHLAISGPDVAIRRVKIPPMSKQELAEAIKWQVKDELPFPLQEAVLDFRVLGEVWDKDIRKLDVLVAAVARQAIEDQVQVIEQAGARVMSVIPGQLALWRSLHQTCPEKSSASLASVELGAAQTHVAIFKDGQLRIARDLPIGSMHFTQALVGVIGLEHGQVQLDAAKAEQLKRHYGIIPESADGATEEGVPLGQLAALMRSVLESLLVELARLFDFYKMQMHEAGVSQILLCGGGASLKHLQPFLQDGLGIPVELYDPVAETDSSDSLNQILEDHGSARLALAFGAALAHGQDLNCLPSEAKARLGYGSLARVLKAARSTGLAVAVGIYLLLQALAWWCGREAEVAQRAWETMRPAHEQAVAVAAETARLEAILRSVEGLTMRQPVWEGVLKELGLLIPGNVQLAEVSAIRPDDASASLVLHLRGTIWPQRPGGDASLAKLLDALEASPFFEDVRLVSSQVQGSPTGTTLFEIQCRLE